MTRRILRILAALAALGVVPAFSADVNPPAAVVKAPATAPLPTGWYLDVEATGSVLKPGGGVATLSPAGAGFKVGGGYDYTAASNIIFGVFGDVGWVNVRGTAVCEALSCSSGSTYEGEIGGRIGVTVGNMNSALAANSTFNNLNGKLPYQLQAISPLQTAIIYWKASAVFQNIRTSVAGMNDSQIDVGFRTGPGIEIPLYASSSGSAAWRTEINVTKFNQAICGGCALPTGRPVEFGGGTGIVWHF